MSWGKFLATSAGAAVIGIIVQELLFGKELRGRLVNRPHQPDRTGTLWTPTSFLGALGLAPDSGVYGNDAAGRQNGRTSFNGQIYTQRFTRDGGNPNYPANFEQSYSFQSATKNPFANGPNCAYARAVNLATIDPTNQATALLYEGPLAGAT